MQSIDHIEQSRQQNLLRNIQQIQEIQKRRQSSANQDKERGPAQPGGRLGGADKVKSREGSCGNSGRPSLTQQHKYEVEQAEGEQNN